MSDPFDWNDVGPELSAVTDAIADTVDPDNPMQTNEASMEFLQHLWEAGYRVVRRDVVDRLRGAIMSIQHPCHGACIPDRDIHADCQCAAYMRQEAWAAIDKVTA